MIRSGRAEPCKKTTFGKVFAQGSLYYRRQGRRGFLRLHIAIHGLCEIVGYGHRRTFHAVRISPIGDLGEIDDTVSQFPGHSNREGLTPLQFGDLAEEPRFSLHAGLVQTMMMN